MKIINIFINRSKLILFILKRRITHDDNIFFDKKITLFKESSTEKNKIYALLCIILHLLITKQPLIDSFPA